MTVARRIILAAAESVALHWRLNRLHGGPCDMFYSLVGIIWNWRASEYATSRSVFQPASLSDGCGSWPRCRLWRYRASLALRVGTAIESQDWDESLLRIRGRNVMESDKRMRLAAAIDLTASWPTSCIAVNTKLTT